MQVKQKNPKFTPNQLKSLQNHEYFTNNDWAHVLTK